MPDSRLDRRPFRCVSVWRRSKRRRFAFKTKAGGTVTVSVLPGQSSRIALAEHMANYRALCALLEIPPAIEV